MVNGFEDVQKVGVETLNRTVESVGALTRGVQSVANGDGRVFQEDL